MLGGGDEKHLSLSAQGLLATFSDSLYRYVNSYLQAPACRTEEVLASDIEGLGLGLRVFRFAKRLEVSMFQEPHAAVLTQGQHNP